MSDLAQSLMVRPSETALDPRGAHSSSELISIVERFAGHLLELGVPVRAWSKKSLERLSQMNLEQIEQIKNQYLLQENWIIPILGNKEKIKNFEIEMLTRALDHYGLEVHPDFVKTIEFDHMIELYGPGMTQIYRSFNFLKMSGYSLMDLSVFEWWVLWERPTYVMTEMTKVAEAVYNDFVPLAKYEVKRHLVREIHNSDETEPFQPRTILADMKYAGSLKCKSTSNLSGAIATSVGQIVGLGDSALSIDFI